MGIDALILVRRGGMAVGALHLFLGCNRQVVNEQAPLDHVILGGVAVDAKQSQAAHVHIQAFRSVVEARIQVTVLDVVAAAAVVVAEPAVFARGASDAARSNSQVHLLQRIAEVAFAIQ